jgi:MerR family transcriptional regulator, light-induced transcriptional regulator
VNVVRNTVQVGKGGQTVSATRFADLTGVTRERLRTWERRFGFPRPERHGAGPRRYALDDVPRVVTVRRRAEQGVPLTEAIAEARRAPRSARLRDGAFTVAAEHVPQPLGLLSGPEPVRLAWSNLALRREDGAPAEGDALAETIPWFAGSELAAAAHRLFTTDVESFECTHPAWSGVAGEHGHSVLWRLPAEAGRAPLVGIASVERAHDRELQRDLGELRGALESLAHQSERQARWLDLAGALAELFQEEAGPDLLSHTADTLVRRLAAVDAGICLYMGGELAVGTSSHGMLGPRMVTVTAHHDLASALRARQPAWMSASTAAAFGASPGLELAVVPVVVVGETLGVVALAFEAREAIDAEVRQILSIVSAGIGFAILRDRLVAGVQSV